LYFCSLSTALASISAKRAASFDANDRYCNKRCEWIDPANVKDSIDCETAQSDTCKICARRRLNGIRQ
jgi:hypothetical protein